MQKLISKFGLAAHLAFVAVAPLFLFPFLDAATIATVELWLSCFAFVWVLMEPSRRNEEMLHDARMRVACALVRDPLSWVLLVLIAFAAVRWLNGGISIKCDFNNGSPYWYLREPSCPFLPGSVEGFGYLGFSAVVAVFALVSGCAHALGRTARISFLFIASTLAGVAALMAVALAEMGNVAVLRAAWCADMKLASFVGTAFGLYLIAGIAALVGAFECRWNRQMMFLLFAVGGNLCGLFFFAPGFTIFIFLGAMFLMLIVSLAYVAVKDGVLQMAKGFSVLLMTLLIPTLVIMGVHFLGEKSLSHLTALVRTAKTTRTAEAVVVPTSDLAEAALHLVSADRFKAFTEGSVFPSHFTERRTALDAVAQRVWGSHPWLGTGLESYALARRFNASEEDWAALDVQLDEKPFSELFRQSIGDTDDRERPQGYVQLPAAWSLLDAEVLQSPFNGWWKLISERGILGALGFAVVLGLLLYKVVRRFVGAWGRSVFVPSCVAGLIALPALVAVGFVDASFLRHDVLAAVTAFLAVSLSSFPEPVRRAEPETDAPNDDIK